MTLHSISTSYPEAPTVAEKQLVGSWIEMFRDTITCPHCKEHFTEIHGNYKRIFPNFLDSRQNFAMFTFRVHNAVNRRLKKPVYGTLDECMATLRNNVKTRSAKDYRNSYIAHITRHWNVYRDITGIVASRKIAEMKRIEVEYIQSRDTNFAYTPQPDIVVLPSDVLVSSGREEARVSPLMMPATSGIRTGIRITATGVRLRR
jgi:hypothetical protein